MDPSAKVAVRRRPCIAPPRFSALTRAGLFVSPLGYRGAASCPTLEVRKIAPGTLQVLASGQKFVLTGARLGEVDCHGVRVGRVKVGYDVKTGTAVALKKVNRVPHAQVALAALYHEGTIGRAAQRDMAAHALLVSPKSAYLVMPLMAGDLQPLAHSASEGKVAALLWAMAAVLRDVRALHGRGIAHRNIKPANVFHRGRATDVRLADFGEASAKRYVDGSIGTPFHMAPEQALGRSGAHIVYDGFAADVWGVGATFVDLFGDNPFRVDKSERLENHRAYAKWYRRRESRWPFRGAFRGKRFAQAFANVPPSVRPLLLAMMNPDPAARPSATAALRQVEALLPSYPQQHADHALAQIARAQCSRWEPVDPRRSAPVCHPV